MDNNNNMDTSSIEEQLDALDDVEGRLASPRSQWDASGASPRRNVRSWRRSTSR